MAKKKKMTPEHPRDFKNMNPEDIVTQIMQDFRNAESYQQQYFDIFKKCYQYYKSFVDKKTRAQKQKDRRASIFIPYSFSVIETITPKLVLALFGTKPYVSTIALGVSNEERKEKSDKMTHLLQYYMTQKIKVIEKFTETFKNTAMYGTAFTKQTWDYETKKIYDKLPRELDGIKLKAYDRVLKEKVTKDHPAIKEIPILDFFFDSAGTCIDSARFVIHRYYEDIHELKSKNEKTKSLSENGKGLYKNLDMLENKKHIDSFGNTDDNFMPNSIGVSQGTDGKKGVEILEYWTDDWVVKIANKSVCIYSEPNPFDHQKKPFSRYIYSLETGQMYGIGALEPMLELQDELNLIRRQRIDNVTLVLNKMYKLKRGANIDTQQLVSRPAGFIEVDEMDDVEEMEFSDVANSGYNEEPIVKRDIDVTTGVNDTNRGTTPTRQETATTMNILSQASSERFQLAVQLLGMGGFTESMRQIISLIKQYLDTEQEIMIIGDEQKDQVDMGVVTPEDILYDYEIVPLPNNIDNTVNKEIRQQNITNLYNMLANREDINHPALIKEILKLYDVKNIEEILTSQNETSIEDFVASLINQNGQGGAVDPMGGAENVIPQ